MNHHDACFVYVNFMRCFCFLIVRISFIGKNSFKNGSRSADKTLSRLNYDELLPQLILIVLYHTQFVCFWKMLFNRVDTPDISLWFIECNQTLASVDKRPFVYESIHYVADINHGHESTQNLVPVDLRTRWCKDRKEIAVKGFSLKFKLRRSDGERRTSNRNGLHWF